MNGLYLFATFAVLGSAWYLTRDPSDRRRGLPSLGVRPREWPGLLLAGTFGAALFGAFVVGLALFSPS